MNILFLAPQPFYQNRGTPIAVKLMLESLSEQGHFIRVLTYPEGDDVVIPNCQIIRLPLVSWAKNVGPGASWKKVVYDLLMFFKARKLVRHYRFDIIHAVEEAAWIGRYLNKKNDIRYVYDMDSSMAQQIVEKYGWLTPILPLLVYLEKLMIRDSVGVIAVCRFIEDIVRCYDPKKLVQRLEDISLLPSGGKIQIDTSVKLPVCGRILMYVGNLEAYQGIDLLLRSFSIALNHYPDAMLVIIGGTSLDIDHYRRYSRQLGISEQTLFMGPRPVSDLSVYLAQADILVSPRTKGFNTPMKIYSYLDSGKAVLATNLPTHTQALDEDIACLSDPDPESMAKGMVHLLQDHRYRRRLGAAARKRVQQEYSLNAYQRKLGRFYQTLETAGRVH